MSFTPWYSFVPLRDDEPASPAESAGVDATPQSGESGETGGLPPPTCISDVAVAQLVERGTVAPAVEDSTSSGHPTIYHGPAKKTPRREFEWRDREDVTRLTIELSRKERDAIHRYANRNGMSIRQFVRDVLIERMMGE